MTLCNHEPTIAAAVSRGELPEDLRLHAEACPACREALSVARKLHELAMEHSKDVALSAAAMWRRLSFRLRREKARQAEAPLIWMNRIFVLTTILLFAALLAIAWQSHPSVVWAIGLSSMGVVALPVTIALWGWSRSRS
jgi:hypothetical protein